jgi:iron complex outermembrane receptor protein
MKKTVLFLFVSIQLLFANSLDSLLDEYKTTNDKSLRTVDEKLGHVFIYSQKDLRLMQYNKLSDILKELPLLNLNKNRFGVSNLSLSGSKTTVSGFFRFFINDHEISSIHTQSPALTWGDLPLDFIDYIEIYYGESSFSLGNENGVYFIRMYTKSASKENGGEIQTRISSHGSNAQSIMHSYSFENGWSYLMFVQDEAINENRSYENKNFLNDANKRYVFFDASNDNTTINLGYSDVLKDNYLGMASDAEPDGGDLSSKDFFLSMTHYFLEDQSLKLALSVDRNHRNYNESNSTGIAVIPVISLSNVAGTMPKEYQENLVFTKFNGYISKEFNYKNNNVLTGLNVSSKQYDVESRSITNFANVQTHLGQFYDFDEERVSSLFIQDDLQVHEKLHLVGNAKYDQYQRSGFLEDVSENLYRIGAIYTPTDNFGLKGFYTQTALAPTFFNIDMAARSDTQLENQQYKYYTLEGVLSHENSRFRITYHNVEIDDFIYLSPVGFININDHTIKSNGLIFMYEYLLGERHKIELNYYTTRLSESMNNSNEGGYIKFQGEYQQIEYFTSLIYKNDYSYENVNVPKSYDVSLGATYNISKDLSLSLKANNILDKSTQSLIGQGSPTTYFALEDYGKTVDCSLKWRFY